MKDDVSAADAWFENMHPELADGPVDDGLIDEDSITDEQIRGLRDLARIERDYYLFTTCRIALGEERAFSEEHQRRQRVECAAALNARRAA